MLLFWNRFLKTSKSYSTKTFRDHFVFLHFMLRQTLPTLWKFFIWLLDGHFLIFGLTNKKDALLKYLQKTKMECLTMFYLAENLPINKIEFWKNPNLYQCFYCFYMGKISNKILSKFSSLIPYMGQINQLMSRKSNQKKRKILIFI